jgi:hypothetical protein
VAQLRNDGSWNLIADKSDHRQVRAPQMLVQETQASGKAASGQAASGRDSVGGLEIALSKMIRNLVKGALFPLFGFGEPEIPAFGIL